MNFARVASLDDLPPGRILAVAVDGQPVALYNVAGAVHATRDECTHESYPLSKGELRGCVVTCALHQWKYDVSTGRCETNPSLHVRRYEVRVEGRDVFVRLVPLPPPAPPPFVARDDA